MAYSQTSPSRCFLGGFLYRLIGNFGCTPPEKGGDGKDISGEAAGKGELWGNLTVIEARNTMRVPSKEHERFSGRKELPFGRPVRFARTGMVKKGLFSIVLSCFLIVLGSPCGHTKSIGEICEEKGILPSRASIVVMKEKRKLFFYLDEQFVKTYPVVFGKYFNRQKLYEGDQSTPEGIFRVVAKRFHDEWSRFILLNYPTWDDVRRHQEACAQGLIPLKEDRCIGLGGGIGIHGTREEALNRAKIDWTDGCISLFNRDIEELFPYLERGDLVFIFP